MSWHGSMSDLGQHPHLVMLEESFTYCGVLVIVMEYCEMRDLGTLLPLLPDAPAEAFVTQVLVQVRVAMALWPRRGVARREEEETRLSLLIN